MAASDPKIRVRMYRQGLGDCFLLTFRTGPQPVHMLIDCGTLGATTTGVDMDDVVADIAAETGEHLNLLIATHEHKDHVSGFNSQRDIFDTFQVDHVWAAWTENPGDSLAQEIKKFARDLVLSLSLASEALRAAPGAAGDELHAMGAGVRELLGFAGDLPADGAPLGADFAKTVHAAMSYVVTRGDEPAQFLSPGHVIEPEWLPGIRFYVLGPPRSQKALAELGDHDSPELYHLAAQMGRDFGHALNLAGSGASFAEYRAGLLAEERATFDAGLPFDLGFRIDAGDATARKQHLAAYDDEDEAWRQIDHEWLRTTEDLAIQLDNVTNNTSLALAIELIEDGRVLLFPADAQLGNWRSWQSVEFAITGADGIVTTKDLLKRTVLYKVGHHASHNATLRDHGLEAMERRGLVAMIPVDSVLALNKRPHPWHMPAEALYTRLLEKTQGRVLRSDTGWPDDDERPTTVTREAWKKALRDPNVEVESLYIDYVVR